MLTQQHAPGIQIPRVVQDPPLYRPVLRACKATSVSGTVVRPGLLPSDASIHRRRIWTSAGCNCTFRVRAGPLVTAPLTSVIRTLPAGLSNTRLAPPALVRLLNWIL